LQSATLPTRPASRWTGIIAQRGQFADKEIADLDVIDRQVHTPTADPCPRLVLALGGPPQSFGIPGLAERAVRLYSVPTPSRWAAPGATPFSAASPLQRPCSAGNRVAVASTIPLLLRGVDISGM
jgi:NADH dehydrogenase FAD-containing subunit